MKTIICYVAAAIIYVAVIGSIACGIIAMICGIYYINPLTLTMGFCVFGFGIIMWSMLQEM